MGAPAGPPFPSLPSPASDLRRGPRWLQASEEHVLVLAVALAAAIAGLTIGLDWFLLRHEGWKPMAMATISDLILSLVAFGLILVLLIRSRQRRRLVVHQLEIIDQMNHHVRNALQVIAFNARPATRNEWELGEIKQAVERIHWALCEVLPKLEPHYQPFESKPPTGSSEKFTVISTEHEK